MLECYIISFFRLSFFWQSDEVSALLITAAFRSMRSKDDKDLSRIKISNAQRRNFINEAVIQINRKKSNLKVALFFNIMYYSSLG